MMTELWWKVFLLAIFTVIIAKLFGCRWDVFLIFTVSFLGWAIGLILLMVGAQAIDSWSKARRKDKRK